MKVTINRIRVELQEVANAHEMINSFFWGDLHRAWNEKDLNYPLCCGYLTGGGMDVKMTNQQLVVVVADKVFKDYSSLNDTESDTLKVCRHIFNTLNKSPRWNNLIRVNSATVTKFLDRGDDEIAGHILTLNVDIKDSESICNLPMDGYDFEGTFEGQTCEPVLIVNSNQTFTFSADSGTIVELPDTPVTVTDQDGNELGNGDVPSVTGGNIEVTIAPSGDGEAVLKDTDGNVLSTTPVPPETTVDIVAPDGTVNVNKSDGVLISAVTVASGSTEPYNVADSTAVLKDTDGTTISTTPIKATESEDIVAPDVDIEINGVNEGSVVSGGTAAINLVDSGGDPVTPDSVTVVDNTYTVEVPSGGGGLLTALPIKTGQTVIFNSYDDGDFQFGRLVDPNTLDEPNVFGNLNRFTAIDGSQTYGATVVFIDHSTRQLDGSIIWYTAGTTGILTTQLTFANDLIREGKSDWRMCPITLYENLRNLGAIRPIEETPLATGGDGLYRSSSRVNTAGQSLSFYNFADAANHSRVVPLSDSISLRSLLYRVGNISEL
jgi:hypothetical protein